MVHWRTTSRDTYTSETKVATAFRVGGAGLEGGLHSRVSRVLGAAAAEATKAKTATKVDLKNCMVESRWVEKMSEDVGFVSRMVENYGCVRMSLYRSPHLCTARPDAVTHRL